MIRDFASSKQLKHNDDVFKCDAGNVHEYMVRYVNMNPDDAQKTGQLRETLQLSRDVRKMFLIGLMSLDATGSKTELLQYTTAWEAIKKCHEETRQANFNLKNALLIDRGEALMLLQ